MHHELRGVPAPTRTFGSWEDCATIVNVYFETASLFLLLFCVKDKKVKQSRLNYSTVPIKHFFSFPLIDPSTSSGETKDQADLSTGRQVRWSLVSIAAHFL